MSVDGADEVIAIDLGDASWSPDDVPGRRLPSWWRQAVAGLVVLGGLLSLGGAAPKGSGFGDAVWSAPGGQFAVIGDLAIITTSGGLATARDIGSGDIRWHRQFDAVYVGAVEVGGGAIGLTWYANPAGGVVDQPTTTVVDPSTGNQLYVKKGSPFWHNDTRTVFMTENSVECYLPSGTCADVVGVDARTGDELWRVVQGPGTQPQFDWSSGDAVTTFGTVDDHGKFTVRDLATGAVLRTVSAPDWRGSALDETSSGGFSYLGDALVNAHRSPLPYGGSSPSTATIAYRGIAHPVEWSVTIPLNPASADQTYLNVYGCDGMLCVYDGGGVSMLNRRTGAVIRQVTGTPTFFGDPNLMAIWVQDTAGLNVGLQFQDLTTGQARLTLHGEVGGVIDSAGRALFLITPERSTKTDVVLVDETTQVHPVGTIEWVSHCFATRELLVCVHGDRDQYGREPSESDLKIVVFRLPAFISRS